jgi:hypothetical protein
MFVMPISLTGLGIWASIDYVITFFALFLGSIESIFLERQFFDKPFSQSLSLLKSFLVNPLRVIPSFPLIIPRRIIW